MTDSPRGRRLMLLAPPGAGKGTQGTRLAEHYGVEHIAVGDLLADHVDRGTEQGKRAAAYIERGELVPDEVILDVVMPRLVEASESGGFVLDGFPRSVPQAEAADALATKLGLGLDAVVYLPVPDDELVQRLRKRNEEEDRVDDAPDVVRRRIRLFDEQTAPLISRYRDRGMLITVDGSQPPDDVTRDIIEALG
jgi:adenylate kinase